MDIISLSRQGHSIRHIARKLGIHRKTVKKYLTEGSMPSYRNQKKRSSILEPYYQIIEDYLKEDNYQGSWIFERIKNFGYQGSYDTVKICVREKKKQLSRLAYIRFETEPGLQAQVDWADFKILESDGSQSTCYAFVMVLGYSRALYVEFVDNCTLQTFMDCHINAFQYLQGVPAEILYDNMKNVVIGKVAGKSKFNVEFVYFAHHYGFQPKTCPPYSAWVKGKVERPINYIRERFWRGYSFIDLAKVNHDISFWLNNTANIRMHGTHRQIVKERWQKEIPHLGKLPPRDYDTSLKTFRKVCKDCQISYNGNRYIVPHQVVGKKVLLKIKDGTIRIYDDQNLLATYKEDSGKGNTVGHPRFYEDLKHDQEQWRRKYGNRKGKATRGLIDSSLFIDVLTRPLSEYDAMAGGALWNN